MLAPPYSSGTVMPSTPTSPILRHRSIGNWSLRSISAARGAISVCANARTASRSASTSSPSWKFRPGKFIAASPGDFGVSVMDAFAAEDRHQRGIHGCDDFFAPFIDGIGDALDDADGAARLDHIGLHAEALPLGRR